MSKHFKFLFLYVFLFFLVSFNKTTYANKQYNNIYINEKNSSLLLNINKKLFINKEKLILLQKDNLKLLSSKNKTQSKKNSSASQKGVKKVENNKKQNKNPIATIEMENGDKIKIELYPNIAPNTVSNFISLIKKDFYSNLIFHRVIKGFMIQGGCPEGTGTGGPDYCIKGEFKSNNFCNNLKHTRGVISMARSADKNSAGSQFFIVHEDSPHLDGDYAAFGKVIKGLDILDKIASTEVDYNDRPIEDQIIKSITVDTFGIEYNNLEIIK